MINKINIFTITYLILFISCTPPASGITDQIIIDSNSPSIAKVDFKKSREQIEALGYKVKWREKWAEGEKYPIATITIKKGAEIILTFESYKPQSGIYSIETTSDLIIASNQTKVGSSLNELKSNWPNGEFIHGNAHGEFARFITNTPIVFDFDTSIMEKSCFSYPFSCPNTGNLRVKKIVIYSEVIN